MSSRDWLKWKQYFKPAVLKRLLPIARIFFARIFFRSHFEEKMRLRKKVGLSVKAAFV